MPSNAKEYAMAALAPAKINLSLEVHGKRPDGFHNLTSLVAGIELYDELSFTPTNQPGIRLTCDDPRLPTDAGNLVVQAAERLAVRMQHPRGATIELRKSIPAAAGLGGGSSDCAAALRSLNRLWGVELSDDELMCIGAELGSDVPLFFSLPAATISGRGERVAAASLAWSGWVVLACGRWTVSTPAVYSNWRAEDHRDRGDGLPGVLCSCGTAAELSALLVNELEPAVFRTVPAVRDFQAALARASGVGWRISGAGSTAFALFDSEADAQDTSNVVRRSGLTERVVVVRNLRR